MLRPGEHTYANDNNHPFRLQDTSFESGPTPAQNGALIPLPQLHSATRVNLNFTTQKNGEKNESLTHGDTSDTILSPVSAVRRRVLHLRQHNAPPTTPLHTYFTSSSSTKRITSTQLTKRLRTSCTEIGSTLGLAPKEISAKALRAGGAMALIRANVDPLKVRMMGRWKSWVMLRYLHRSAMNTSDLSEKMLTGGNFVIPRHAMLPTDASNLLKPVLD